MDDGIRQKDMIPHDSSIGLVDGMIVVMVGSSR
jgi:hypothetical protein